tara:strand:+ start:721 stop:957 length:237 start_codon:yes stop_codon:yes gene_type:complete
MSEQAQVVTIDGKEYKQEDLSVEQLRLVSKVAKFQKQSNDLKDAFEDSNKLQQSYLFDLKTSLANSETMNGIKNSKAD